MSPPYFTRRTDSEVLTSYFLLFTRLLQTLGLAHCKATHCADNTTTPLLDIRFDFKACIHSGLTSLSRYKAHVHSQ